jgi:hypothetical protein
MAEYRAMLNVYRRRSREAEQLQTMLLAAGASVENVQQEMAPLFAAVVALKMELADFEQINGKAARLRESASRKLPNKRKPRQLRRGR